MPAELSSIITLTMPTNLFFRTACKEAFEKLNMAVIFTKVGYSEVCLNHVGNVAKISKIPKSNLNTPS